MSAGKNDTWVRRFEVTDPRKHKNGFVVYKVTSVVFPRSAPEASTRIVVWKRYNDFKQLHKTLKYYHKQIKISENFPSLSKGRFFRRLAESLIKERICFALELLNFIGRHQSLFTSEPFIQFFKTGYQVSETCASNVIENSNVVDLTVNNNGDPVLQRNCLGLADRWDSISSSDSTSVTYECSDEDSSIRIFDTPSSLSPVHSQPKMAPEAKEKFEISETCNSNTTEGVDDSTNISAVGSSKQPVEVDTLHATPCDLNTSNETFYTSLDNCVPDILQPPSSSDSESWLTPPETPADPQDYLVEAAHRVSQAQKFEIEGEFEAAFCFYKAAIGCLLSGVEDDQDPVKKQAVKEKANQYLQRAEKIYDSHLAFAGPKKITDAVEELKTYKVLRVIDSVLLVTSSSDEKCYVIKVLQKSPCPVNTKKTTIPYNVPYMVKLYKYFENENSVFLVLQYAKGGKLWNRLRDPYKGKHPTNRVEDGGEFRSCSSPGSQYEMIEQNQRDLAKMNLNSVPHGVDDNAKNSKSCSDENESLVVDESTNLEKTAEGEKNDDENKINSSLIEDLEVINLLENSQKLLNSVSRTLEMSEKLTNNVNMELLDIENVFDLNCRLVNKQKLAPDSPPSDTRNRKKRSKSAVPKAKVEKSYSSEDLTDSSRPRTASSSIDRRTEWSRLTADLAPRISESVVRNWAAEMIVCLETLHRHGIICRDLRPDNILLDESDSVLVSHQANWKGVDSLLSEEALAGFYAAPENMSVFPITPAADWWSFGALLHELLTGKSLVSCYPEGILGHTILTFPDFLSPEACSLLTELLRYEPSERLGSSVNGSEDIKCHPFFNCVNWELIYDCC